MKKILLTTVFCLSFMTSIQSQEVYWGFDSADEPLIVPPECDTIFDDKELYEVGMSLYKTVGRSKRGSAYCLVSSALLGNSDAAYQVAKMYHEGSVLPVDELAAYKWSIISSLQGNEDATELSNTIEQGLGIKEIETATNAATDMVDQIKTNQENEIAENRLLEEQLKASIEKMNLDISLIRSGAEIKVSGEDVENNKAEELSRESLMQQADRLRREVEVLNQEIERIQNAYSKKYIGSKMEQYVARILDLKKEIDELRRQDQRQNERVEFLKLYVDDGALEYDDILKENEKILSEYERQNNFLNTRGQSLQNLNDKNLTDEQLKQIEFDIDDVERWIERVGEDNRGQEDFLKKKEDEFLGLSLTVLPSDEMAPEGRAVNSKASSTSGSKSKNAKQGANSKRGGLFSSSDLANAPMP